MPDSAQAAAEQARRLLGLYHLYRLSIGLAMVLLVATDLHNNLLPLSDVVWFQRIAGFYLTFNLVATVILREPRRRLLSALALGDIALLLLLFYLAGGTPSGIGPMMVISVAIASILLPRRMGLLMAAIASIGLVGLTFRLSFVFPAANTQFVQAGALGALCFGAALLVQSLTSRLQASETLARKRARDVANLEELNALILQRMRTGIMVINGEHRVLLANQGALNMLGKPELVGLPLEEASPELLARLDQWRDNPTLRPDSLAAMPGGPALQTTFTPLQHGNAQDLLIFIEDLSQVAQQAQQLKLAALGRLTAGIAHEIRNPLGAISHAAQLLEESDVLDAADRRLAQIIQDHSRRMNLIIENVLQLSRRRQAEPQLLDLKYWVHRFASEYRSRLNAQQQLHVQVDGSHLQTRMDPNQLIQILSNLVQNGLRYSAQRHAQAQVWLTLYCDAESDLPVLEVADDGPGVPAEDIENIFEPFFTTDSQGTGLGLYLCRELCESNQARIDYRPREGGGSCFRVVFAHRRKLG